MSKNEITIIAPCYNEENNINEFYIRIKKELSKLKLNNYKFIFIDDGSIDTTWNIIEELSKKDKNVDGIQLVRNFGHQNAICSAIPFISSNYTLFIDVDMQDPPELLSQMYKKIKEKKINIVYGKRIKSNEGFFKKFFSKIFYSVFNIFSDTKIPSDVSDFRLIDENVLNALIKFKEQDPFLRGIVSWLGFKSTPINFVRNKRIKGSSGWSNKKMINFSISAFMGFSTFPMRLSFYISFVLILFFIFLGLYALYTYSQGYNIPGWTSLFMIMIIFFIIQFFILGLISEYTGRIYNEVKNRPRYIINQKIIND